MKLNFRKERTLEFIKKYKIHILIAVLILILIVALTVFMIHKNKNKTGNTISNLQNGGTATIQGDTIYYCKLGNKAGVYSIKQNGKNETKIKYTDASYLNAYKNDLYYVEHDDETDSFSLIKSRQDGEERETLVKDIDNNVVTINNEWVYYFQNKILYRIKTNGKDNMKVLEQTILNYGIQGDYIYYVYNNGEKNVLARKALEDVGFLKLAENVSKYFEIIDNNIFFVEQKYNADEYEYNYTLFKMKINGKNRREIFSLPNVVQNINITKNAIYYTIKNNDDIFQIYCYQYKENEPILLKETSIESNILVAGKWLFYTDLTENGEQIILKISTK